MSSPVSGTSVVTIFVTLLPAVLVLVLGSGAVLADICGGAVGSSPVVGVPVAEVASAPSVLAADEPVPSPLSADFGAQAASRRTGVRTSERRIITA